MPVDTPPWILTNTLTVINEYDEPESGIVLLFIISRRNVCFWDSFFFLFCMQMNQKPSDFVPISISSFWFLKNEPNNTSYSIVSFGEKKILFSKTEVHIKVYTIIQHKRDNLIVIYDFGPKAKSLSNTEWRTSILSAVTTTPLIMTIWVAETNGNFSPTTITSTLSLSTAITLHCKKGNAIKRARTFWFSFVCKLHKINSNRFNAWISLSV